MAVKERKRPLTQDPVRVFRKRVEARLDQGEAAIKARITRQHLSAIERGISAASPAVLGRIADAYGCDVTDLMPAEPNGTAA